MIIISNSFSPNMLPSMVAAKVNIVEVTREEFVEQVKKLTSELSYQSIVGHKATADVLSQILGFRVVENRVNYTVQDGDIVVVFTPGIRLEEGKVLSEDELKKLPGRYFIVTVRIQE